MSQGEPLPTGRLFQIWKEKKVRPLAGQKVVGGQDNEY